VKPSLMVSVHISTY